MRPILLVYDFWHFSGRAENTIFLLLYLVKTIDIKKERQEKLERTRSNEMVHEIVYETVNICEPERRVEYVECSTFKKCMYLDFTFFKYVFFGYTIFTPPPPTTPPPIDQKLLSADTYTPENLSNLEIYLI